MLLGPFYPQSPVSLGNVYWFVPMWEDDVIVIQGKGLVEPLCGHVVVSSTLPAHVVVVDLCMICGLCRVHEVIELGMFPRCEQANHDIRNTVLWKKLLCDPFQCAVAIMVLWYQGAIVPMLQVLILLVENVQFLVKEPGEMAKHKIRRWFVVQPKVGSMVVCFDGTVGVVFAEVGVEGGGVCTGGSKARWDAPYTYRLKEWASIFGVQPNWEQRFLLVVSVVDGVITGEEGGWNGNVALVAWSVGLILVKDGSHALCDVVQGEFLG